MFGTFGPGEIFLILAVLLLIFGAKRLPELGGALGKGIREFKQSVREIGGGDDKGSRELGAGGTRPAVGPGQEASRADSDTSRGA